jgi:hypothetical protein
MAIDARLWNNIDVTPSTARRTANKAADYECSGHIPPVITGQPHAKHNNSLQNRATFTGHFSRSVVFLDSQRQRWFVRFEDF